MFGTDLTSLLFLRFEHRSSSETAAQFDGESACLGRAGSDPETEEEECVKVFHLSLILLFSEQPLIEKRQRRRKIAMRRAKFIVRLYNKKLFPLASLCLSHAQHYRRRTHYLD